MDLIYINKYDLFDALAQPYEAYYDSIAIKNGEDTWACFLRACDLGISIKPCGNHHVVVDHKKFMIAQLKHGIRTTNQTPA